MFIDSIYIGNGQTMALTSFLGISMQMYLIIWHRVTNGYISEIDFNRLILESNHNLCEAHHRYILRVFHFHQQAAFYIKSRFLKIKRFDV